MTQNEKWMQKFDNLVRYINFYSSAPPHNSVEYTWIRNQLYSKIPCRQKILEEMAPGITSGKIVESINKALRNGTKYIKKCEPVTRCTYCDAADQQQMVINILCALGIQYFDELSELLYKESLHIKTGKISLDEIYSRLGLQKERIENTRLIMSNASSLSKITGQYRNLVRSSKVGVGNLKFASKITGSIELRELIKEAVIVKHCKEALYNRMGESQKRIVEGLMYKGLQIADIAKELQVSKQFVSQSFKLATDKLSRNLTPLIKGQNLSLVEKLKPTVQIETDIFNILLNSYNNEDYGSIHRRETLILFRLGLIGRLGESAESLDLKLSILGQVVGKNPEILKLGISENIEMINKEFIENTHKLFGLINGKSVGKSDKNLSKDVKFTDPIEVLNLSLRAYNILRRNGIDTIQQLSDALKNKLNELENIRGMGNGTLDEIITALNRLES